MHKSSLTMTLLLCALALSACARNGRDVKQISCPEPQTPPPALMTSPDFEKKARRILFDSEPSATPKSKGSKD